MVVTFRTAVAQHGMLNRDPWAIGLLYVKSSKFYTDLMCVSAFPLVMWSSPHFAPLQLVTLIYISEVRLRTRSNPGPRTMQGCNHDAWANVHCPVLGTCSAPACSSDR